MTRVLSTTLGGLLLMAISHTVLADPLLSIQPAQLTQGAGSPFTLNVNIQGATDVYAFQFDVTFTPSVLTVTGLTEGPFLASGGGSTFWVPGRMGNGTISAIADTLLGPIPGVSGNGTLATLNFVSTMQGTTSVALSNILLLDSSLHEIASSSTPASITITPEPTSGMLVGFALLTTLLLSCRKLQWKVGAMVLTPLRYFPRSCRGFHIYAATLAIAAFTGPAQALAPGYQFTIVVKRGDTIGGKVITLDNQYLAINDAGTVVFTSGFAGGSGVFTPSQLLAAAGDTISGKTLASIEFTPAINNAGTVVFHANLSGGGQGLFTPDRLLVETGDVISGVTVPGLISGAQINNTGTVVFVAYGGLSGSPAYLFTLSQLLVASGDQIGGNTLTNVGEFSLNDEGAVVFGADFIDSAGNFNFGAFSLDQLLVAEGQEIGGVRLFPDFTAPLINNAGSIVLSTAPYIIAPDEAIFTPSEVLVRTGDLIGGTRLSAVGGHDSFAMNNAGTVAFVGNVGGGIFTTWEAVALIGDTISGKTLNGFGPPVINNAGTIAFLAGFTDGTDGIIIATPISSGVAGDVNGDGLVDCKDLAILKSALERKLGQAGFSPRADVNGDGIVDLRDLAFVAQRMPAGTACPGP